MLNCPQCGQLDKVQKVSALFTQGISHTSYEGPSAAVQIKDTTYYGTQERTAISQTALSKRLAPPASPNIRKPIKPGNPTGCIAPTIIGVLIGIGMIFAGPKIQYGGNITFSGIVLVVLLPIGLISTFSRFRSGKASREYERNLASYNRETTHYESAKDRWDSAYYCGRCDGVFSQTSKKITPINEFYKFIDEDGIYDHRD